MVSSRRHRDGKQYDEQAAEGDRIFDGGWHSILAILGLRSRSSHASLDGANEDQTVGVRILGLLLTTEVMIAEAPKEEEHAHGAPGGMGGMGGMDM